MTKARHKAHVPWWRLRRKYQALIIDHHRLRRAYRDLEAQWGETFAELLRLQDTYEPVPGTAWGSMNALYEQGLRRASTADIIDALEAWDPPSADAVTEEIPVFAVGVDPGTGNSPSGIAVIKVSGDGTAEVITDESR